MSEPLIVLSRPAIALGALAVAAVLLVGIIIATVAFGLISRKKNAGEAGVFTSAEEEMITRKSLEHGDLNRDKVDDSDYDAGSEITGGSLALVTLYTGEPVSEKNWWRISELRPLKITGRGADAAGVNTYFLRGRSGEAFPELLLGLSLYDKSNPPVFYIANNASASASVSVYVNFEKLEGNNKVPLRSNSLIKVKDKDNEIVVKVLLKVLSEGRSLK